MLAQLIPSGEFLMPAAWVFDEKGPQTTGLSMPIPLSNKRMGAPDSPGLYVVTCGDCLAHIGTSGQLADRIRGLARLGHHRGSAEVLCAAFCTWAPPLVRWEVCPTTQAARQCERALKDFYGEPPVPRDRYRACVNGGHLRQALINAAGTGSWAAGFIEAVFTIGQDLSLLFGSRFAEIWHQVGKPPGPW